MHVKEFLWNAVTLKWLPAIFKQKVEPISHSELVRQKILHEDRLDMLLSSEQSWLKLGKDKFSSLENKKRCAAQLAQIRKEIKRVKTLAFVVNSQINLRETNRHNLELIALGNRKASGVPASEVITQHHVEAEQLLEELQADSELASSLSATMSDMGMSEEELEIMKEFDAEVENMTPPISTKHTEFTRSDESELDENVATKDGGKTHVNQEALE